MPQCKDMKEGQIYYCENCGLEIEIKKECNCTQPKDGNLKNCTFICCGLPLKLKQSNW